jgi:hypothetical protein
MPEVRHIEDQLRAWADDLAAQVPPHTAEHSYGSGIAIRRPRRWIAVAAAVIALAALVTTVLAARIDRPDRVVTTPDPMTTINVPYEQMRYGLTTNMRCEGADQNAMSATIESWSNPDEHRWRNRYLAPDGTTRDTVAVGSPFQPAKLFASGPANPWTMQCGPLPIVPGGPDALTGAFVTLDPVGAEPRVDPAHPSRWRQIVDRMSARQPGVHRDSLGRPAELRRYTSGATVSVITSGVTTHRQVPPPTHEDETWDIYVDPESQRILEVTITPRGVV